MAYKCNSQVWQSLPNKIAVYTSTVEDTLELPSEEISELTYILQDIYITIDIKMLSPEFEGSQSNGAFTVELHDYIVDSNIDYWIYGHSHRNIDTMIGNTQCICNQFGYAFCNEHSTFVPNKFIESR